MNKLKHQNLYAHHKTQDVYESLQSDYNRDTYVQMRWHGVLIACAAGAAYMSGHSDWLWIFGGLFAIERAIAVQIDNSNRNWFMHSVDYHERNRSISDDEQV